MEYTVEIAKLGLEIKIRKPTRVEFLKIADKKALYYSGAQRVADPEDDGDEELIALVSQPDEMQFRLLLQEQPALSNRLWVFIKQQCGYGEMSISERKPTAEQIEKYGKIINVFQLSVKSGADPQFERTVVFHRLSRISVKLLSRESSQLDLILDSSLFKIASDFLVEDQKAEMLSLFESKPALAISCGASLFTACKLEQSEFVKKA